MFDILGWQYITKEIFGGPTEYAWRPGVIPSDFQWHPLLSALCQWDLFVHSNMYRRYSDKYFPHW